MSFAIVQDVFCNERLAPGFIGNGIPQSLFGLVHKTLVTTRQILRHSGPTSHNEDEKYFLFLEQRKNTTSRDYLQIKSF
jgi:hypothetical protein